MPTSALCVPDLFYPAANVRECFMDEKVSVGLLLLVLLFWVM